MPETLLQPVLEIFCYFTGYVIVPVLSLGKAYVEPAPKGVRAKIRWHGVGRDSKGRMVLHAELGMLIGLVFWIVVIVAGIFVYKSFSSGA